MTREKLSTKRCTINTHNVIVLNGNRTTYYQSESISQHYQIFQPNDVLCTGTFIHQVLTTKEKKYGIILLLQAKNTTNEYIKRTHNMFLAFRAQSTCRVCKMLTKKLQRLFVEKKIATTNATFGL